MDERELQKLKSQAGQIPVLESKLATLDQRVKELEGEFRNHGHSENGLYYPPIKPAEPKCELCDGTGLASKGGGYEIDGQPEHFVPCPDCKPADAPTEKCSHLDKLCSHKTATGNFCKSLHPCDHDAPTEGEALLRVRVVGPSGLHHGCTVVEFEAGNGYNKVAVFPADLIPMSNMVDATNKDALIEALKALGAYQMPELTCQRMLNNKMILHDDTVIIMPAAKGGNK